MSYRPLQEYYPPLKERGMVELAAAKQSTCVLWYLVAAPAATSVALSFVDVDGNLVEMADANYTVEVSSEGRIVEPDESTKTTVGLTLLSKDYTGSAANFANSINVQIMGRLASQPVTQL